MVAFAGLTADPPGCVSVQLAGPGRAALGIASLGPPSKGQLRKVEGTGRLPADCPTQTIGLKVPFKDLEIVSDMGTEEGSLPITKPIPSSEIPV